MKLSGVMLCYGAIDGRATIFFCTLCMTYIFEAKHFDMIGFALIFGTSVSFMSQVCFLYILLCILRTYFVLTPFLRGAAFHARRYRRTVW